MWCEHQQHADNAPVHVCVLRRCVCAAAAIAVFSRAGPAVAGTFPFDRAVNWGAMRTPEEWKRRYEEIPPEELVDVPAYELAVLTSPMRGLARDPGRNAAAITAKLFYSTRYCGRYDLDAGEYTGAHCALDIRMPAGAPVRAVARGRVQAAANHPVLGLHVIVAHRVGGTRYFSVYAHLEEATVKPGATVREGQVIGKVGLTGRTAVAHLHLQIDRDMGGTGHVPYLPGPDTTPEEAARHTIHPLRFIEGQ